MFKSFVTCMLASFVSFSCVFAQMYIYNDAMAATWYNAHCTLEKLTSGGYEGTGCVKTVRNETHVWGTSGNLDDCTFAISMDDYRENAPVDLTNWITLQFAYKNLREEDTVNVFLIDYTAGATHPKNSFHIRLPYSTGWTLIKIPIESFGDNTWYNRTKVSDIAWSTKLVPYSAGEEEIWIDDVKFTTEASTNVVTSRYTGHLQPIDFSTRTANTGDERVLYFSPMGRLTENILISGNRHAAGKVFGRVSGGNMNAVKTLLTF